MSIGIALRQILIIFGYMLIGFLAGKLNIINAGERKFLSRLITAITLPFTIIAATNVDVEQNDLVKLALAGLILILNFIIITIATMVFTKMKKMSRAEQVAYTGLCVYPNAAFIGIPLCTALMGTWGTIYGAAAIAAFNIVFFTVQTSLFTNEKFRWKSLLTVVNVSTVIMIVMLACRIRLPETLQTICSNVGGMTTPLALIIVGVMISEGDIVGILKEKRTYYLSFMRNLFWPFLLLLVLSILPLDADLKRALLIYSACPVANVTTVYAIQADMEPELCAETTMMSTLLFAVTLPVMLWFAGIFIP